MDEEVGAAGRQQVCNGSIDPPLCCGLVSGVAEIAFDLFGRPAIQMTPGAGAGARVLSFLRNRSS